MPFAGCSAAPHLKANPGILLSNGWTDGVLNNAGVLSHDAHASRETLSSAIK
jgi:hypothetical protein